MTTTASARVESAGLEAAQRAERKRAEILEAARRRFIADGYAGAGMEAVARDTAISTATLYDHFPSKLDLFRCFTDTVLEQLTRPASETFTARSDRTPPLLAFARAYARFLSDPSVRTVIRVLAAEPRRFAALAAAFEARGRGAYEAALLGVLNRLGDEGRIAAPNPRGAAGQLMGMIEHAALVEPLLGADQADPSRLLDQVCEEAIATFLARYGSRASAEAA
jgi:AcrR family transcriptional regulator